MGSLIEAGRDGSGQMYRRNRYYDPAIGRFTQEDPIGLAGGLNLYGFASGDPVNFSDPFGLCHTIQDEKEKKKCKLREASEQENKDMDDLEQQLAAHRDKECRDAGEQIHLLRSRDMVRFYDNEFGNQETGMLAGDVLSYKGGAIAQIHVYSWLGSPRSRSQRVLGVKAGTLHEARHSQRDVREADDDEATRRFVTRCTGIREQ